MRILILLSLMIFSISCQHGSVGYRSANYKEVPTKPMRQSLAEALGSGYTVTILEGPDTELTLPGSGVQFSSYNPFGSNWDFDVTGAFMSYPDIPFYIQYQGPSSGTLRIRYQVTGSALDLAIGYRWGWLRPYAGLRSNTYVMTSVGPFITSSTAIRNFFGFGGLDLTIPLSSSVGLSLRGDYASVLTKDSTIKSADITTFQLNVIWGLDKK